MTVTEIIGSIREARKRIRETEPDEVRKLLKTMGSYEQNCTLMLYAESETRQLVDFLYCLRDAAKKEEVTLESIKAITNVVLEFYAEKFDGWYHMTYTVRLFRDAVSAVGQMVDKAEYNALLEELLLYVGKLNLWIEVKIPWYEIIGTYEWIVHGKP